MNAVPSENERERDECRKQLSKNANFRTSKWNIYVTAQIYFFKIYSIVNQNYYTLYTSKRYNCDIQIIYSKVILQFMYLTCKINK